MPNALKVCCNHDDLRRRGSALRGSRGYANHHGRCSNRKALPVCVTRHSRQFAANRGCRSITPESTASSQSRGFSLRLRIGARPAILSAPSLSKANLAEVGHLPAGKAIVTESSRDAPSFARASRGVAPGPTRCILGRQVELGCCTRDAGRWPWRVVRCEKNGASQASQRSVSSSPPVSGRTTSPTRTRVWVT